MECLKNLVGLKDMCAASVIQPLIYLDDIEGIDISNLAALANENDGSGNALAQNLIDGAIRLMKADIEGLYASNYTLNAQLGDACSTSTFTGFFLSGAGFGTVINFTGASRFSVLKIPTIKAIINNTGTYNFILDDGVTKKVISHDFTAGVIQDITVNYSTVKSSVKIYFEDPTVAIGQLTQAVTGGCGCGGNANPVNNISNLLQIAGLSNYVQNTVQYGFIPCVQISCSWDNLICTIVNASPNIIALALVYKVAYKYFSESVLSTRNNRVGGYDKEEKKVMIDKYGKLYHDVLEGNKRTGIRQIINQNLAAINDGCIVCKGAYGIAWAT